MENVRSGRLNYQVQVLHTGESNTADKLTGGEEAQFNNEAEEQKVSALVNLPKRCEFTAYKGIKFKVTR